MAPDGLSPDHHALLLQQQQQQQQQQQHHHHHHHHHHHDHNHHDRNQNHHTKPPSGLISFLHRRQTSTPRPPPPTTLQGQLDGTMATGCFAKNNPGALGELQQNQQESAPRSSPQKAREDAAGGGTTTTTYAWGNVSLKPVGDRQPAKSPAKPKKTKSSTNLVGLLSRPKSLKNLYRLATEDEVRASMSRDKENRQPDEAVSPVGPPPPIFAQFTSDPAARQQRERSSVDSVARPPAKDRPLSLHVPRTAAHPDPQAPAPRQASSTDKPAARMQRGRVLDAFSGLTHARAKSSAPSPSAAAAEYPDHIANPSDIDRQLEDLLDRRNIPENQRYKMRNLSDTIKMEFIRQDWAEMQAARMDRSVTADSAKGVDTAPATPVGSDCDDEKPRRSRGRSFTFSRGKKDSTRSPSKKPKGEGTLGRHLRSKSTESVTAVAAAASERPSSSGASAASGLLSKIKLQQGPADYVVYLRKVQKPELVEVGKLHKLRLLLRNETVAWIEDFIQQGGMKEIVELLNRIMGIEWR
ncbi:hypothetical protein CDD83_2212 [Cordyceps sp. RAO-2017]|nr:hypothetical protein CDD83_2212 [Cordyceps sp. RAO-2017]